MFLYVIPVSSLVPQAGPDGIVLGGVGFGSRSLSGVNRQLFRPPQEG